MADRERIILRVEGMTCDGCVDHVTRALQQVPGVLYVDVPGWQAGRAEVIVKPDVSDQVLIDAISQAGYRGAVQQRETLTPNASRSQGAQYDVVVVGGGSAGFAAAIRAAEEGARVLLVNEGAIGGTCVNVGCVPSKALIRALEVYHRAGEQRYAGVYTVPGALHWHRVIDHKDALVADLRQAKYVDVLAAYPQITYLEGKARLVGGTRVQMNGETYTAAKVILATGARPWAPPIPGLAEAGYLTSTTAMALRELPRSLIVLGGNAIGLELAQVFARAGVAVTVIELLERIAPFEDEAVSEELARHLAAEGITLVTGASTQRVERDAQGYRLHVRLADGKEALFTAEQLLVATGRRANTEGLDLDAAGIQVDRRGFIEVNEYAQTSHPDIYAAGDCTTLPQFVYVAAHSGTVAAENALLGNHRMLELDFLPRVTFTDPQVAAAGLTEAEAREQGYDVKVSVLPLEHVPRALAARDTRGLIKLIADRATDRLLGAHIVAAEAGEIIQIAVLAMKAGITVHQLAGMLFPYLTLAEGLKLAAQTFEKDVAKLSCCAG